MDYGILKPQKMDQMIRRKKKIDRIYSIQHGAAEMDIRHAIDSLKTVKEDLFIIFPICPIWHCDDS